MIQGKLFHLFFKISLALLWVAIFTGCYTIHETPTGNVAVLQEYYQQGQQAQAQGNWNAAYQAYHKAATQGYAPAQAALGAYYAHNSSANSQMLTAKGPITNARFWLERAVAQNDARAQYELGNLYLAGKDGLTKNSEQALQLYEKSAAQHYQPAQAGLVQIYSEGRLRYSSMQRVAINPSRAMYWRERAAAQGHALSQYELGRAYHEGREGKAQNLQLAQQWYERAAVQNYRPAHIGLMLLSGEASHYPCYVNGPYGIPVRQPGIARRADDWCL